MFSRPRGSTYGRPVINRAAGHGDRFWLMPVLDAWTNVVADLGAGHWQRPAHAVGLVGLDWPGARRMTLYRSTNLAWAILRIQVDDGLDGISELQDGFRVAPLSNRRTATRCR